ncbi:MAG: methylmalonyl Co-A mutase-associated GTPase MeaB, partial [Planctomycetes bacterium]|nr:methylmalonyl Co-A mutase-associated GTPase MeaB [Planctomycetota bacterium]
VIVETVGVGQSEVEVAGVADTTLVVLTPNAGDSVQALKAGIMEVADVVVINKADKPGAQRLEEDVREGLDLRPHPAPGAPHWPVPIVRTVATDGTGVAELAAALAAHEAHLRAHGLLDASRARRRLARLEALAREALAGALHGQGALAGRYGALRARVEQGSLTPRRAVARLLDGVI